MSEASEESGAESINNEAEPLIVGYSNNATYSTTHAVSWLNSSITDLGTLEGDPAKESFANDVNDFGEIAGKSNTSLGGHAFIRGHHRKYDKPWNSRRK